MDEMDEYMLSTLSFFRQFLVLRDIKSLKEVCKSIKKEVNNSQRHLKVAFDCENSVAVARKYVRELTQLQSVDFSSFTWRTPTEFILVFCHLNVKSVKELYGITVRCGATTIAFSILLNHFQHLHHLDITVYSNYGVETLIDRITSVKVLKLKLRDKIHAEYWTNVCELLKRCSNKLTHLSLDTQIGSCCTIDKCVCEFSRVVETLCKYNTRVEELQLQQHCLGKFKYTIHGNLSLRALVIKNMSVGNIPNMRMFFSGLNVGALESLEVHNSILPVTAYVLEVFKTQQCRLESLKICKTWRCYQENKSVSEVISSIIECICDGPSYLSLRYLDLSGQPLTQKAVCLLRNLTNLQDLNISHVSRFYNNAEHVGSSLRYLKQLKSLNLSFLFLEDQELSHILQCIADLRFLECLDISSNNVGEHSVLAMELLTTSCKEISKLDLDYCFLTESCLIKCIPLFRRLPLVSLKLVCTFSISHVCNQYEELVLYTLQSLKTLLTLHLSIAVSSDVGRLVKHIVNRCPHLQVLTLRIPVENDRLYSDLLSDARRSASQFCLNLKLSIW
jgi:hypothetical protein